ncbi:MAG: hypothetical protein H0T83_04605 [Chthoniobacterales bacterium]|nr:hypothetical protein [Chthoniobacterales bacterium]
MKKTKLITLVLAFSLTTLTISAVRAHAGAEHGAAAKTEMQIPDTTEGIMAEIKKKHEELDATVKNKKLADVHHHAFAIRDLAKALPAKTPADKQTRVQGAVNNLSKLAEDLDTSGDAGDQARTESNLKKFDAALAQLEGQFK